MKPKDSQGNLDKEVVKALYMKSPFVEWVPFAEAQGWNPYRSRTDFPVREWTYEKRKVLGDSAAAKIGEMLIGKESDWHQAIFRHLEYAPKACDRVMELIEARLASALEAERLGSQKISMKDLANLTRALKLLVDAKCKSLMIDRWSFDSVKDSISNNSDENPNQLGPKITIEGQEVTDIKQMQEWFDQWIDKPQKP